MSMTDTQPLRVVQAVFEANDRHDLDALRAHPGLCETVQYIPRLWAAIPDLRHTIERQFASGDTVTTVAVGRGTHRGPLLGVEPTHRPVSFLVLSIDQVSEGRIVLHYGLPDWLALLATIGALPTLAPTA
jgi:predicted ester cyclase